MWHPVEATSLSLAEVKRVGRAALFLDWGEKLLYREGEIFELHETLDERAMAYPPVRLPSAILEHGVGIEYGWRHLAGCDCEACTDHRHRRAA